MHTLFPASRVGGVEKLAVCLLAARQEALSCPPSRIPVSGPAFSPSVLRQGCIPVEQGLGKPHWQPSPIPASRICFLWEPSSATRLRDGVQISPISHPDLDRVRYRCLPPLPSRFVDLSLHSRATTVCRQLNLALINAGASTILVCLDPNPVIRQCGITACCRHRPQPTGLSHVPMSLSPSCIRQSLSHASLRQGLSTDAYRLSDNLARRLRCTG